jgi:hypothetical protein
MNRAALVVHSVYFFFLLRFHQRAPLGVTARYVERLRRKSPPMNEHLYNHPN